MAHEIAKTADGRDAMVAWGRVPVWHGLGQRYDRLMTLEEAADAAGLYYPIDTYPSLFRDVAGEVKVGSGMQIVRTDTMQPLGQASEWYKPLNNRDAFEPFAKLIGQGIAGVMTAGVLKEGRKAWVQFKLGQIGVDELDRGEKLLLVSAGHTGSSAVSVGFTTVWVVCANTEAAADYEWEQAEKQKGQDVVRRIMHMGDVKANVEHAARMLDLANKRFRAWEDVAKSLAAVRVEDAPGELWRLALEVMAPADTTIEGWLKEPKNIRRSTLPAIRQALLREYHEAPGQKLPSRAGTAWGMLNAVTSWVDYERGLKRDCDSRSDAILFGSGNTIKTDAAKALVRRYRDGEWTDKTMMLEHMFATAGV